MRPATFSEKVQMVCVTAFLILGAFLMMAGITGIVKPTPWWSGHSIIIGGALFIVSMLWCFSLAYRQIDEWKRTKSNFLGTVEGEVILVAPPETIEYLKENLSPSVLKSCSDDQICLHVQSMLSRCFKEGDEWRKKRKKK